ncbi:hypothetical protein BJY01DRAFT_261042 [Aspergillus pseudoustus]|uniref:F-box domain-containing protein n=1 Tax=Aspergillus pseudoustus TaxID=1810923 RepID=A0ABR4ITB4_9EURO
MPQALKCPDVDALSVLDNRAATYTKLLQYDQALKDSRQMIKHDKQDERGYLRCAKALLLDGKPEKALEVYAYALKSLPKDRSRRRVVEAMHQKLQDKLRSKCYDPFTVFPYEIARMVVEDFDFRELVAILRVSKGWDRFLSSMRDLWMRLDFSRARSKIHWSSVLSYIRRSKAMLTQAVVTNLTKASIRKVLEYISRCPNLQHLEILCPFGSECVYELFKGCKQLKFFLISAETPIPQSTLTKLLSSLPNLEHIEIHKATKSREADVQWPPSLSKLQSITLGTTESSITENYLPALYIPRMTITEPPTPFVLSNLTELRLHSNPQIFVPYPPSFNPADFPRLQKLDMSGIYVGGEFALPSSLQFLRIQGGAAIEALPFALLDDKPLHLPNLETLVFSDVPWVTHVTLMAFMAQAKAPMRVLHVDSCLRITATTLVTLLREYVLQLETLNVAHLMGVDDTTIYFLIERLTALKVLNLSYTDITGVTLKMLVDAHETDAKAHVECVYVKGCEGISSDAIDYGRARGLAIVI